MVHLHAAAAALVIGVSMVALVLVLAGGLRVVRRRRAARSAARDTPLRRAARQHAARVEHPVMHWVPDDHSGGWHLVGSYLPVSDDATPVSPPRRRRRSR